MALRATVFKVELSIADMDRGYYRDHVLTLARHPSETDERLMVRLLAFALCADEGLAFGRGLSADDEPDLWQRDLTGVIRLWIDVGLPDEKTIRRAAGRAGAVRLYAYGGRSVGVWWDRVGARLSTIDRLTVIEIPREATAALAGLVDRSMRLQCTIQDGHAWVADDRTSVEVTPRWLKGDPVPR
ncbi:MAG: YaeQ family protein [Betaproteobacteria bacterium]|nr:YaeQ family protein [Betaproteobacteria bacterium]MBK6602636.1 YaeQ family protein [Betaproteobacteria bacterium]MBK7589974.1 YaeQ family protein [Betaproteobacteria bacterium]MBK9704106.1 YaeQ family protein [Betaproteobacteria bacterium]